MCYSDRVFRGVNVLGTGGLGITVLGCCNVRG